MIQQGGYTYKPSAIGTACKRLIKDQTRPNSIMNSESAHTVPLINKKLLVIYSSWDSVLPGKGKSILSFILMYGLWSVEHSPVEDHIL